jgi:voltage-dependent potassium channel beta subunit
MEYRILGNTGLKVSVLSLGSWITFSDQLDDKEVLNHMALAFDNGINLFDNAEAYGFGIAETKMGTAIKKLKWTRDSYIITSKVLFGGDKPTQKGLNKKHINDACTNSLIRLNLEYLDIFYCHRHDPDTPLLETIYAMNDLIIQGKILYWGTSEWSLSQLQEVFQLCDKYNLRKPVVEQLQYNLINKSNVESNFSELTKQNYGLITWSPLASGVLTGKYNNGTSSNSRLTLPNYAFLKSYLSEEAMEISKKLNKISLEYNIQASELALLWCLQNKNVNSVLIGASNLTQLQENISVLDKFNLINARDILKKYLA